MHARYASGTRTSIVPGFASIAAGKNVLVNKHGRVAGGRVGTDCVDQRKAIGFESLMGDAKIVLIIFGDLGSDSIFCLNLEIKISIDRENR